MPSPLPFTPREQNCEWIGSRYTFPEKVRDGDAVIQPQVIMWLELPRGVLLGSTLVNPRNPVSLAETLEEALRNPIEGLPRRPARIRVPDQRMARELRRAAAGIPIIVAPVPELDAAFAELSEELGGLESTPTYLGDGDIAPAVVKDFFSAAVLLFRAGPWRHVQEHQVLRVDIPRFEIENACLSVIGAGRESEGILLFRSIQDFLTFGSTTVNPELISAGAGIAMRSLSFDRKKTMPPSMIREIEQHRWPIAGAKAYPALLCFDAQMSAIEPAEHDYRIMTACTQAFVSFFARHRHIFAADAPDQVCESLTSDNDLTVTLTAPDFTEELAAALLDDASIEIEPPPAQFAAGRNDPCPCGSGKKYKKCHFEA
ncbi:MAG TPA: SEC-C metal-binding domain-containing protein [Thermoanaerobaculia bacterium]|nr:SEC-C metal-binding domain-containing protein [Thermoanaerobaculia bacterium]